MKDPDDGHVDTDSLLEHLRDLETQLHRSETRRNRSRMESLLHPDFVELARSGRRYSRNEVLEEFEGGRALEPVHAQDFELAALAPGIALLTYQSAHAGQTGDLSRHALRSSIWIETPGGWRIRFHQGTPAEAFR